MSAAAVLALNPLVIDAARSVRGYSMLLLCAVLSCLLTVQVVERGDRPSWSVAYVAVTAAGLATHLYMGLVLAGQIAFVVTSRGAGERWRTRWYLSALLGSFAYLALADTMVGSARLQRRVFQPWLPLDLARGVLGEHPAAIASLAVIVAAAAWLSRFRREAIGPAAVVGLLFLAFWTLIASHPEVRFFMWLVPAVAACTALVVARWRMSVVPVAAAVAAMGVTQVDDRPEDRHVLPIAASVVDGARARGDEACAVGAEAVAAYTTLPRQIFGSSVEGCDVLVLFSSWYQSDATLARAAEQLPHVWRLPGTTVDRECSPHRPVYPAASRWDW